MRLISIFCAVSAALLLTGCVDPVVFAEVFQLRQGQKLHTAYNIWYEEPEAISCLNIQRGSFIPLGTEIQPIKTVEFGNKIIFKTLPDGKRYIIRFKPGYRLCSMRDYIGYTFTTKNTEELLAGVPKAIRHRILRGEVVPGMNQAQVQLAYGPPPAIRTPDLRNETWIYWIAPDATVRLIFRGDVVRNILNINH